jgi:predicted dienelactone hydrolase
MTVLVAAVTLAAAAPLTSARPAALADGPRASWTRTSSGDDRVTPPDQPGPDGVGYRTVTIIDDTRPNRPLTTSVWYPTTARLAPPGTRGGPAAARYEIAPGIGLLSRVAVADAPVRPGHFPLVVFSHGSAGNRVQFASLAEALTSRGYVVAAPDHPGDTMTDVAENRQEPLADAASDRPLDVWAVIDWMLRPDRTFGPDLDPDRVAVVGFSFGGLTAIASSVGFLKAPPDPRVKVVVGISPATEVMPASLVAQVHVPTLLIGGTDDPITPIERNADRTFAELPGSPARVEVRVAQATHNSFSDLCQQAYLAGDGRLSVEVGRRLELGALATCTPPMVDPAAAQRVARWYTVAFLERYLRGDPRYDQFLAPTEAGALRPASVTVLTTP